MRLKVRGILKKGYCRVLGAIQPRCSECLHVRIMQRYGTSLCAELETTCRTESLSVGIEMLSTCEFAPFSCEEPSSQLTSASLHLLQHVNTHSSVSLRTELMPITCGPQTSKTVSSFLTWPGTIVPCKALKLLTTAGHVTPILAQTRRHHSTTLSGLQVFRLFRLEWCWKPEPTDCYPKPANLAS